MTQEQYDIEAGALHNELEIKMSELNKKYAIENNPYNVGDIIEDHYHIIKIEHMSLYKSTYPSIMYTGVELTKKLTPCKIQKNKTMYQTNVKRKLN